MPKGQPATDTGTPSDTQGIGADLSAPENQPLTPQKNEPAAPGAPTTPADELQTSVSSLQAQLEEMKKRHAGTERERQSLQRRVNELTEQIEVGSVSEADAQAVINSPLYQRTLLELAELQLKQGVVELLERYPEIDKRVAEAIKINPRGWINPSTSTVPQALLDIEGKVADLLISGGSEQQPSAPTGKEFGQAAVNATTPTPVEGKKDLGSMTSREIEEGLDSGSITMEELEKAAVENPPENPAE